MYLHLEAITIAEHCVRLLLQRAVGLQGKRVKEHLAGTGGG